MGLFDIFFKSTSEIINKTEFPKFEEKIHSRDKRVKSNYIRKNYYYKNYDKYKLQEYISKIKGFKEITVCEDETEAYEYWKNNFNPNPSDCCNLRK